MRRWFWHTWLGGRICVVQMRYPWLILNRRERAYARWAGNESSFR